MQRARSHPSNQIPLALSTLQDSSCFGTAAAPLAEGGTDTDPKTEMSRTACHKTVMILIELLSESQCFDLLISN